MENGKIISNQVEFQNYANEAQVFFGVFIPKYSDFDSKIQQKCDFH